MPIRPNYMDIHDYQWYAICKDLWLRYWGEDDLNGFTFDRYLDQRHQIDMAEELKHYSMVQLNKKYRLVFKKLAVRTLRPLLREKAAEEGNVANTAPAEHLIKKGPNWPGPKPIG